MKKLWVLFIALFATFGIVACSNDDPTEIEFNLNEQLDVPSNLSVNESTKTLSWDAVENAARYNVYVNGELETELTTTTFDFSDITGDRLMFTIKAMAPTGLQNSNVSTTIAYVANRESEISQMKLSIQASDLYLSDEDAFATELVNKGMLSEDFDAMMDDMGDIESAMVLSDISDVYSEFDQLFETMDIAMIEAFISSLIKVELRTILQDELDNYEANSQFYSQESIQELDDLLQFIDDKGDEAVKSAMIVIEYLVDVQNGIDSELVNNMETMMDSEQLSSENVSMLLGLKNDLVTNFKENLPELQDVIVLNSTMVAFMGVLNEESMDTSIVSIPKQSAQSLISIELFFNFILEMDETYVGALVDAGNGTTPDDTKPFVKENIRLIDQYLENNDVLIQQLNNIYTDTEKEDLFYDYYIEAIMNSYYDMMFSNSRVDTSINEDISLIIEEHIDFDNILILQESMGETFNELLDAIIESDYALIDAFYQVAEVSEDVSSTETELNESVANLMNETFTVMNPLIQDLSAAEYRAIIDLIFGQLIVRYEMNATAYPDEYSEMVDIIGYIEIGFLNTTTNQLNIFKDISDLLDQNNYIDQFVALYQTGNVGTQSDEYYGAMILVANAYLDFYNDSENDVNAIIDEMITVLSEPDVKSSLDLTTTDIEEIETSINNMITDLEDQANIIKDYDYTDMSASQKDNVDEFVATFAGVLYMGLVS